MPLHGGFYSVRLFIRLISRAVLIALRRVVQVAMFVDSTGSFGSTDGASRPAERHREYLEE